MIVGQLNLSNCYKMPVKFPVICDKNENCLIAHTKSVYISEHINQHRVFCVHTDRPIKFNHHNSVRHCSGTPENFPSRAACLSAGLLWCLLTQEAYPEASATHQQPSCKRPGPLEEYSVLPCCLDSVSKQKHQDSSQVCSVSREHQIVRDHEVEQVQEGLT